jgi:hypothetical protein
MESSDGIGNKVRKERRHGENATSERGRQFAFSADEIPFAVVE